jgi:uncharacterized protein
MKDLKEKVIAVLGVSNDPGKFGYKIFAELLDRGFLVHGVNPKGGDVRGQSLAISLDAVSPVPEMVITVVPPAATEQAVETCRRLGIKEIWMQPGSESDAAIAKAGSYGMSVTHHACLMTTIGMW